MAGLTCFAKLAPDAFASFNKAKDETLTKISSLISDDTFKAVNGVYDYASKIPGFVGDATKPPAELLAQWNSRFAEIENNIMESIGIDRTETMRDFLLTANGYAQYFGNKAEEVLDTMKAQSMITLNGFTDLMKNASPEHFLQMTDEAFTELKTNIAPEAVAAAEQALSQLNAKLLSNEILNDAVAKLKVEQKDFFEKMGFNECLSL